MLGKDIKYLCVLFYVKKFENMKSYEVCVKCLYSGFKTFKFIMVFILDYYVNRLTIRCLRRKLICM